MTAAPRRTVAPPIATGGDAASLAGSIYEGRRLRDETFAKHPSLFGEPAWDLLLDLYVSGAEDRRISIIDGCLGTATPTTTALRHRANWSGPGSSSADRIRRTDAGGGSRSTTPGRRLMDRVLAAFGGRDEADG